MHWIVCFVKGHLDWGTWKARYGSVAPFFPCHTDLSSGRSVLADPEVIDKEFRKAWLPFFVGLHRHYGHGYF